MKRAPSNIDAHREAKKRYEGAPRNLWLIARTPTHKPYPCMCRGRRPCTRLCPCNGRTDTAGLPSMCCARRTRRT